MSALAKLIFIGLIAVTLTACGKPEAPDSSTTAPTKPATSVANPASKSASKPAAATQAAVETATTFRTIKARLRDSGEQIDILVPEDMDIDSGRMLEYAVDDNGNYYLKSLIPQ